VSVVTLADLRSAVEAQRVQSGLSPAEFERRCVAEASFNLQAALAGTARVEDDAEVVATWVADLAPAARRRLTVAEVRCARCEKLGLLLRVVVVPHHLDRQHADFLAIPTRRAQSAHRPRHRARWLIVQGETWELECQRHWARWTVGMEHLTGVSSLPGLNVVLPSR